MINSHKKQHYSILVLIASNLIYIYRLGILYRMINSHKKQHYSILVLIASNLTHVLVINLRHNVRIYQLLHMPSTKVIFYQYVMN